MYYHASQTKGIKELKPHISNHKVSLVYFSSKRENVLVYLSNAIEKFCKENNFEWNGQWETWASYCFDKNGIQVIEEYYPNALEETYKGVSGYIYSVKEIDNIKEQEDIRFSFTTEENVVVDNCEYIEDAYDAILEEEKKGNLIILRYEEFIKLKKDWLYDTIKKEYMKKDLPSYEKFFLENKFNDILKGEFMERMNKEELLELLKKLKIDSNEFTILSSSALVLRDIYPSAGDLDIAVTEKGLNELKNNYNLKQKENGWYIVNDKVECVKDDMNGKREKYNNYYLQDINDYLDYLELSSREKDKLRIPIVKEYIKNKEQ